MTRMTSKEYREFVDRQGESSVSGKRSAAGRKAQEDGESWESFIIGCLEIGNWWWDHARPMQDINGIWRVPLAGMKGRPDFTAIRGSEIIYIEAKSGKAVVSPAQGDWIERLRAAGQTVYIWRPSDRAEVEAVLLAPRK